MKSCIVLLLLIPCFIKSQNTKNEHHTFYYFSLNPEKLAHRLTDKLPNDSLKVHAIHNWITHHIKYDSKKADNYDFHRVSTKKILKKRKATCVGYSDLFVEMCRYADIIVTEIPGYTKNEHTDLYDKSYLDDHMWNAVYLNNHWKLVDVCWDAGYIKSYNRTFLGHIIYVLSLGKREQIKLKPKFVFKPTNDYFLKNGVDFLADHLPLIPIWQLTQPMVSIHQFEMDSSFYYNTSFSKTNNERDTNWNRERYRISKMGLKEKILYYGPISHEFNPKNHNILSLSQWINAEDIANEIDVKSRDKKMTKSQCEEAIALIYLSKKSHDSTLYYLSKENLELTENNTIKNNKLKRQNNHLISSTRFIEKNLSSGQLTSNNYINTLNLIEKKNAVNFNNINNSTSLLNAQAPSVKLSDTIKVESIMDSLINQLNSQNNKISTQLGRIENIYYQYKTRFIDHTSQIEKNIQATSALVEMRKERLDDMDHEITSLKDSLYKYKFSFDTILIDSVFLVNALINHTNVLKDEFTKLYENYKSITNELIALKRKGVQFDILADAYDNNVQNYYANIQKYSDKLYEISGYFTDFRQTCHLLQKSNLKERLSYEEEQIIEQQMNRQRTLYINYQHLFLSQIIKSRIKELDKLKSKIEKIKIGIDTK